MARCRMKCVIVTIILFCDNNYCLSHIAALYTHEVKKIVKPVAARGAQNHH